MARYFSDRGSESWSGKEAAPSGREYEADGASNTDLAESKLLEGTLIRGVELLVVLASQLGLALFVHHQRARAAFLGRGEEVSGEEPALEALRAEAEVREGRTSDGCAREVDKGGCR